MNKKKISAEKLEEFITEAKTLTRAINKDDLNFADGKERILERTAQVSKLLNKANQAGIIKLELLPWMGGNPSFQSCDVYAGDIVLQSEDTKTRTKNAQEFLTSASSHVSSMAIAIQREGKGYPVGRKIRNPYGQKKWRPAKLAA